MKNEIEKYKRLFEDTFNKLVCNKTISDFKLDFGKDIDENGNLIVNAQVRLKNYNSPVSCYTLNKFDFPELSQDDFIKMCDKIKMEIEKSIYEKEETI